MKMPVKGQYVEVADAQSRYLGKRCTVIAVNGNQVIVEMEYPADDAPPVLPLASFERSELVDPFE